MRSKMDPGKSSFRISRVELSHNLLQVLSIRRVSQDGHQMDQVWYTLTSYQGTIVVPGLFGATQLVPGASQR